MTQVFNLATHPAHLGLGAKCTEQEPFTGNPDGCHVVATLNPGEAIINPAGVWHTADVDEASTAFFITAGVGTEMRGR